MKMLLTFFMIFSLEANVSFDLEPCCPVTLSTAEFDVSHETEAFKTFFSPIEYDEDSEMLIIKGKLKIDHVDIFETDDTSWKLLVESDKLHLSKSFFKNHDTKLRFYLEDISEPYDIYLDFK